MTAEKTRRRGHPGCFLILAGLVVGSPGGLAQVPDNRGVSLKPSENVAPAYQDTLEQRDADRLDRALDRGRSYLPTVQGEGESPAVPSPRKIVPAEPRVRPSITEYPVVRITPVKRPEPRSRDRQNTDLTETLDVLFETWNRPPGIVRIRYPKEPVPSRVAVPGSRSTVLTGIHAGTGLYARTLHAIESSRSAPVLLELLQPPLAGAIATGEFDRKGKHLGFRFKRLEHQGQTFTIDAWAVSPECGCFSIPGEIDHHLLQRVLLPAAAGFAEGFLTAAARPAESVSFGGADVTWSRQSGDRDHHLMEGLGAVARSLSGLFLQNAPRESSIRIPRNTEVVLLFTRSPVPGRPDSQHQQSSGEEASHTR